MIKAIESQRQRGVPDSDLKLTKQHRQIYELMMFEDKFLNKVFPHPLHIDMCKEAAKKATRREFIMKEHALVCLNYSEYLVRQLGNKPMGHQEAIKREKEKEVSDVRQIIEVLEYDEDFAFKLCSESVSVYESSGEIIPAHKLSTSRNAVKVLYPYQDVCRKAIQCSPRQELYSFASDCLNLAQLIIGRSVRA